MKVALIFNLLFNFCLVGIYARYCVINEIKYRLLSYFYTSKCYKCTCVGKNKYSCVGGDCPIANGYCIVYNRMYRVKENFTLGCNCTCISTNRFGCDFTHCPVLNKWDNYIFEKKLTPLGNYSCVADGIQVLRGSPKMFNMCYICSCIGPNLMLCEGKYCPPQKNICYNRIPIIKKGNIIKTDCHCACLATNRFYCSINLCIPYDKKHPSRGRQPAVQVKNCNIDDYTFEQGHQYVMDSCYVCTCVGNGIVWCDGSTCPRKVNTCYESWNHVPLGNIVSFGCSCSCVETNQFFCDYRLPPCYMTNELSANEYNSPKFD